MNDSKKQRECPVCGTKAGFEVLHTQNFVLPVKHPLPDSYDIVACLRCGVVYADSSADQAKYDKYYQEMSRYDMNYTCPDSLIYVDRAAWINSIIPDKAYSIIDVGCGNGHLLFELKNLGLSNLTGLDPSEKCVSDLRAKGIDGIASSIFTVSTNRQWDCAILSGVLEHVYDVWRIIETMRRLLRLNGLLFVCVPDASRYQNYDAVPFDYFNIEHINHFDETSLINLGLQHGFCVVDLRKTTITLAETTQPVIFCVYENVQKVNTNWQLYSGTCITEYIEHTQKEETVNSVINQLMEKNEEIILWGAGNFTNRLLANSNLKKCNIVMIVDSDKHKQGTLLGLWPVVAPYAILEQEKTATILIAVAVFFDEIIAEIRRLGLTNKIIALGKTSESLR